MIRSIEAFFYCRQMKQAIQNANLFLLLSLANSIDWNVDEKEFSRDQCEELVDVWVQKVLLLVNDFSQLEKMLESVEDGIFYQPLIRAYGERTKSIDSILRLLDRLWVGVPQNIVPIHFNQDTYQDLLDTEFVLAKRAKVLSAGKFGLGHIAEMAGLIQDRVGDGRGSRVSEDIVIALALPKLKLDFLEAMYFANNFKLQSGVYRFLKAFVEDNGLTLPSQAIKIADHIRTANFGGKELAQTILKAVDEAPFDISEQLREKLEGISGKKSRSRRDGMSAVLSELLMASLLEEEADEDGLPRMDSIMRTMSLIGMLEDSFPIAGKDSRSGFPSLFSFSPSSGIGFSDVFEDIFGGTETHNHPGSMSFDETQAHTLNKCFACSVLDDCPAPEGQMARQVREMIGAGSDSKIFAATSEEELLQKMEQGVLEDLEAGKLHEVRIDQMTIWEFLESRPDVFSSEAREKIFAAVAQ
jgi:hypothetical protein